MRALIEFDDIMLLVMIASAFGGRLNSGGVIPGSLLFCFDGLDIECASTFKDVLGLLEYESKKMRSDGIVGIGHRDFVTVFRKKR